ncbi:MAG TPA: SPFH domain-containing protein [Myxococcales bacterium]|jgi:membrane protease subunit (stomatin/prohibitin family)
MGIFSSIANEAKRNFVARPDEAKGDIIYKFPEHNIRMMTQLTCQPDELAIFVSEGKVKGKLGPGGTYSLDTKNIPFLSALLEKATGGNLFIAEIFFVSTRVVPNIKFGGSLGSVTDNVTQMMCDAMVFGDFSVQVTDPEKLLFGLVGSGTQLQTGNAFLEWFKNILLKYLSDAVGELGETKGWSLNKMISPHFKLELQKALLEQIKEEVDAQGIKVLSFGNFVLSISDEDKAALNEKNMAIADDQRRMNLAQNPAFMTVAQAEMMRNAGKGMAKGGEGAGAAMSGMGMGMGFQMANMFGQQQQQQQQAQQQQQMPQQPAPGQVKCPACSQMSAAGKFCMNCGKPLGAKCDCGADLAPGAKFCASCGKPAAGAGPKKCECGTEIAPGGKFCPNCGKPA